MSACTFIVDVTREVFGKYHRDNGGLIPVSLNRAIRLGDTIEIQCHGNTLLVCPYSITHTSNQTFMRFSIPGENEE